MENLNNIEIDRFWSKCNVAHEEECWNWLKSTNNGYGFFVFKRKNKCHSKYAHRLSWELTNGDIPNDLSVLHKCDNRLCVNPNHLFLGTAGDNMKDKVHKKRQTKGSDVPTSKLNEKQVKEIRDKKKNTTVEQLSFEYDVSKITIFNICARRSWKHVL